MSRAKRGCAHAACRRATLAIVSLALVVLASGCARALMAKAVEEASCQGATRCEDFIALEDGHLPKGWLGGDGLAAFHHGMLRPFEPRERYSITAPFSASGDWKLEVQMAVCSSQNQGCKTGWYDTSINLGSLSVRFEALRELNTCTNVTLGTTSARVMKSRDTCDDLSGDFHVVVVEKRGEVVTLHLNSRKLLVGRYPDASEVPSVTFESNSAGFILGKVQLTGAEADAAGKPSRTASGTSATPSIPPADQVKTCSLETEAMTLLVVLKNGELATPGGSWSNPQTREYGSVRGEGDQRTPFPEGAWVNLTAGGDDVVSNPKLRVRVAGAEMEVEGHARRGHCEAH